MTPLGPSAAMLGKSCCCAKIYAASCSGASRLAADCRLPLVHIGISVDPAEALRNLNATNHGSAVRWDSTSEPLRFETGWDDWDFVRLPKGPGGQAPGLAGIRLSNGFAAVDLPRSATIAEFAGEFYACLRHLRLQEVVIQPAFLETRSGMDALSGMTVHPRYTAVRPFEVKGAALVTDIFTFDVAGNTRRLLWLAASARLAAVQGVRGPWI